MFFIVLIISYGLPLIKRELGNVFLLGAINAAQMKPFLSAQGFLDRFGFDS